MTKRKVGAGGYAESSDESSDHATPPPPKKSNVPITISRSAQPSACTFQPPTPAAPAITWSSAPKPSASAVARTSTATPLARQPQVAMPTPEETLHGYESLDAGRRSASPAAAATARKASNPGTSADMASGTKGKGLSIPQLRSRFALEGKVDGLEEGMQRMTENICALNDGVKERDAVAAERDVATNKRPTSRTRSSIGCLRWQSDFRPLNLPSPLNPLSLPNPLSPTHQPTQGWVFRTLWQPPSSGT